MNGSRKDIALLVLDLANGVPEDVEIAVFPPFVFIDQVAESLTESQIRIGGQNVDWRPQGAVTGEIEPDMLKEAGCSLCLVGHSERRALFGETDEQVAFKFAACIDKGLRPVLCVGETLEQRRSGETLAVVTRQIEAVINEAGMTGIARSVIAYEPVWAIGTGESARPEQAEEVHASIRNFLGQQDQKVAQEVQILYGGSVKPDNAQGLFAKENIDGALVGGASLVSKDFIDICVAAANRVE